MSSTKSILSRIVVLEGDCGCENLMLSESDRKLIAESVTIIYNFAATVNFKAKFKRAIEINIRGVRELLALASECKNLKLFCHMSTAFSHVRNEVLLEKFYKPPLNPNEMIELMEKLSENDLEDLLQSFLSETLPNSYALTKSASEALIFEAHKNNKLPLMIIRPAIVTAMLSNPLSGWIDNFNNIAGLTAAFGSGVLRSLYISDPRKCWNMIPVDYSASEIMMATWDYKEHNNHDDVAVINNGYTSIEFENLKEISATIIQKYPFDYMMW
jgi:fatty acyl-CoA reductase